MISLSHHTTATMYSKPIDPDWEEKGGPWMPGADRLNENEMVARIQLTLYDKPEDANSYQCKWRCYVGAIPGVDIAQVVATHFPNLTVMTHTHLSNGESYAYVCRPWPEDMVKFYRYIEAFVERCKTLRGATLTETHVMPPTVSIDKARANMRSLLSYHGVPVELFGINMSKGMATFTATTKK